MEKIKLSDPLKRGAYIIFYGSEKDRPCGCQFTSKDELGREVWADFHVLACDDIDIMTSGYTAVPTPLLFPSSISGITAEELIENLKACFKKCGCEVEKPSEIKPPSPPSSGLTRREYIAKQMKGRKFETLGDAQRAFAEVARRRV